MPRSLSCGEVRLKRASQDGILLAWVERPRPMSVRKVVASGTKGVGLGIEVGGTRACRNRGCCGWRIVLGAKQLCGTGRANVDLAALTPSMSGRRNIMFRRRGIAKR